MSLGAACRLGDLSNPSSIRIIAQGKCWRFAGGCRGGEEKKKKEEEEEEEEEEAPLGPPPPLAPSAWAHHRRIRMRNNTNACSLVALALAAGNLGGGGPQLSGFTIHYSPGLFPLPLEYSVLRT